MKRLKQNIGFTLMEILVVIIILGILATAGIPLYNHNMETARAGEGVNILTALCSAQKRYALENNGQYATAMSQLDLDIPTPANFNAPTVAGANPIASITRITNDYTLSIDSSCKISCGSEAVSGTCNRIQTW